MSNVVDLQKQTIGRLETLVSEQAKQIGKLMNANHNLSRVLAYMVDPEFRDFCFKLTHDQLLEVFNEQIIRFLENESNSQEWV